ncbi:acyl-CoA reductase [Gracilimonas sp.]|uniref:acyl-CoA reductase n=1 Tax=Gracilimonas sp. TaxID=1974203 RepID=UPI002870F695|nr:acyl-CoA reductase [Gracilimonas sp.]
MKEISTHIDLVKEALEEWLSSENASLQESKEKTISEGLFSLQDVEHQLSVFRKNLASNDIEQWIDRAGLNDQLNARGQKVLCLHAGNLPLVGFQTAVGTILAGADYYGKLSQKDPYLLASFLDEVKKQNPNQEIQFSTDLESFRNLEADKVVFAGSDESVPEVKEKIREFNAATSSAKYIVRTAKYSVCFLGKVNTANIKKLTEAMLRYGGKGCRSVAAVVSEHKLDKVKGELEKSIQEYWKENPQHKKPGPNLRYKYAYNYALDKSQLWLQDFLIQESEGMPGSDFTVNWMQGDLKKIEQLKQRYGAKIQSIYTAGKKVSGFDVEDLKYAQSPFLYWKPDGMDTIEQLIEESS